MKKEKEVKQKIQELENQRVRALRAGDYVTDAHFSAMIETLKWVLYD